MHDKRSFEKLAHLGSLPTLACRVQFGIRCRAAAFEFDSYLLYGIVPVQSLSISHGLIVLLSKLPTDWKPFFSRAARLPDISEFRRLCPLTTACSVDFSEKRFSMTEPDWENRFRGVMGTQSTSDGAL